MGVYYSSVLVFGVPVEIKEIKKDWTETRYNEKTGEPYEKAMSSTERVEMITGSSIVVPDWDDDDDDDDVEFDYDAFTNSVTVQGYNGTDFIGYTVASVQYGDASIMISETDRFSLSDRLRERLIPFFEPDHVDQIVRNANLYLSMQAF